MDLKICFLQNCTRTSICSYGQAVEEEQEDEVRRSHFGEQEHVVWPICVEKVGSLGKEHNNTKDSTKEANRGSCSLRAKNTTGERKATKFQIILSCGVPFLMLIYRCNSPMYYVLTFDNAPLIVRTKYNYLTKWLILGVANLN